MFLHALAQRLIIFQNDRIEVFDGSYQHFLDKGGWQDENMTAARYRQRNLNAAAATKRTKKELRRQRSEIISERSRILKPLQERIIKVEKQMEKEEAELGRLNLSMQQAAQDQDGSRITEISQALHAGQQTIDRLFVELEDLTRDLDARNAQFEARLNDLDSEIK
jgi:ATP-binding cassette subfamily F protein 3